MDCVLGGIRLWQCEPDSPPLVKLLLTKIIQNVVEHTLGSEFDPHIQNTWSESIGPEYN